MRGVELVGSVMYWVHKKKCQILCTLFCLEKETFHIDMSLLLFFKPKTVCKTLLFWGWDVGPVPTELTIPT